MSTSTTIPATIEIRRSRLISLVAGVAAVAAAITWALSAYAFADTGQPSASAPAGSSLLLTPQEHYFVQTMTAVCSVVMCQPNAQFAARLGLETHR